MRRFPPIYNVYYENREVSFLENENMLPKGASIASFGKSLALSFKV